MSVFLAVCFFLVLVLLAVTAATLGLVARGLRACPGAQLRPGVAAWCAVACAVACVLVVVCAVVVGSVL